MNVADIHAGLWVRTVNLESNSPILAEPDLLANRQEGLIGEVLKPLVNDPHTWWIRHEDGKKAPYTFQEMEALDPQPAPPVKKGSFRGSPVF